MKKYAWIEELEDFIALREISQNFITKETLDKFRELYQVKDHIKAEDKALVVHSLQVARIAVDEIGLGNSAVCSIIIYHLFPEEELPSTAIEAAFGKDTDAIVRGLKRVKGLYSKTSALGTENFRKLLMSLAEDIRVVLILLADRLYSMRNLQEVPIEQRDNIAKETAYLYAPLAHRMGLYQIKTEMEDASLKFMSPKIYKEIARKLSETKRSRDAYIEAFITPLQQKIKAEGFDFVIKGRTKSIYSIWNKIKKKNTPFEDIYDLFAIRIILKTPPEKEKAGCWQIYSMISDMYPPNPKRLRDWLSMPKPNGYESLHTTVMGPKGKFVEVQIRSERMDLVAEKGLAAHWRYKGVQGEKSMDSWLENLRETLNHQDLNPNEYMEEFKMNLYDEEVFAFTPQGDLHKLPKGATLLDFAFAIHTQVGSKCIGGKLDGKNINLKYQICNGDQIEIITSSTQKPRASWMNLVMTSKAKQKIRQVIKEHKTKEANDGKEILLRRFKNWKIEYDDARFSRLAKKKGYKTNTDLLINLSQDKTDLLAFREEYLNFDKKEEVSESTEHLSADKFEKISLPKDDNNNDVLIINNETKGVHYTMAKCCNPIFGDDIFGFVSVSGSIRIHRKDCPNAPQMISRFGYRIVKTAWTAENSTENICTLNVIGNDDLSIITNINSIISKENNVTLRSISINSNAGLFEGRLVITVNNTQTLNEIIQKIRTIKGVSNVSRV